MPDRETMRAWIAENKGKRGLSPPFQVGAKRVQLRWRGTRVLMQVVDESGTIPSPEAGG